VPDVGIVKLIPGTLALEPRVARSSPAFSEHGPGYQIEGITLSGGEPIHQIDAIAKLLFRLEQAAPDLGAGLFTGYTERELEHGRFETYAESDPSRRRALWRDVRGLLDFAVFGRFNQHQPSAAPMVSSRNQQLRLLPDRYRLRDFEDLAVEITIESDGLTQITGFPTLGSLV
jgi:anaerobic ribonucleoside-triphosphate reductase activating protein